MTFGYDSVVFMSHSTSGVADFAIDLLERIRLNRQSAAEANRDIVFVCHSLGGIVCKKALVIAHERPEYLVFVESFSWAHLTVDQGWQVWLSRLLTL